MGTGQHLFLLLLGVRSGNLPEINMNLLKQISICPVKINDCENGPHVPSCLAGTCRKNPCPLRSISNQSDDFARYRSTRYPSDNSDSALAPLKLAE
jgi:hypothetical protein